MFVMYCIYGESRSSLLIESTDSTIIMGRPNYQMRVLISRVAKEEPAHAGLITGIYNSKENYLVC